MTKRIIAVLAVFLSVFVIAGCGGDDDDDDHGGSTDDDTGDDDTSDDDTTDDDTGDDDTWPPLPDDDSTDDDATDDDTGWEPSTVVPIGVHPVKRGWTTLRGLIHMHSVYSHDACDGVPFVQGHPNWPCYNQLREAICTTDQQFIFLTDHDDPFVNYEFPDVLLYNEEDGDELIYENDDAFANIIACPNGDAIITAGNENSLMPLGLRRMPAGDATARSALLNGDTVDAVNGMKALGALVFVPHSEGWATADILALPIDGLEVYNLHANIDPGIREDNLGLPAWSFVFDILAMMLPFEDAAHSDLFLLAFLDENAPARMHWDKVLYERRTVVSMATDAHRNALPFPLLDGDRADSYRRMMRWFANYVLVQNFDIHEIEQAVGHGRMYGAFEVFGEPVGFDFRADADGTTYEMGDEVSLDDSPIITVVPPTLYDMPADVTPPSITLNLWRADGNGGTLVAGVTDDSLTVPIDEAGAYYVTATIVPYHLERWLGDDADRFIREYPFIYGNAIYVTE